MPHVFAAPVRVLRHHQKRGEEEQKRGERKMGATPVEILDQLTDQPASFLFNMATPPFRSAAAKHIGTGFKWKSSLSPMIYHTDAGVGEHAGHGVSEAPWASSATPSGLPGSGV